MEPEPISVQLSKVVLVTCNDWLKVLPPCCTGPVVIQGAKFQWEFAWVRVSSFAQREPAAFSFRVFEMFEERDQYHERELNPNVFSSALIKGNITQSCGTHGVACDITGL